LELLNMVRLLTLICLVPALLSAQVTVDTSSARPISLAEAVQLARRNSPLTVQTRSNLRVAKAGINSAWFAFLPSASVSMSSSWRRGQGFDLQGDIITVTQRNYSDAFSAQVTLFDGGERFFNLSAARAQRDAAEALDIAQEYVVEVDVKRQYYDVLAAQEAEEAARAQLAQAEQQLRVATVRVAAGAASKSDSLRALVLVGNARLAILDAQNRVQLANAWLTRLVGTSYQVTASADNFQEPAPEALDQAPLHELALRGPLVDMAAAELSAAKATARAMRTQYLPTISAGVSRSGFGLDRKFGFGAPYNYSSGFGLSLFLPLLDGLRREEQVVRANVAVDNAEASLRDAQLQAQQDLTQSLGLFRNAGQRVAVQVISVAASEEDLRLQQQRYALGAATILDVLTSQTALNQARTALIAARFDQRYARARLEALIGRPLVDVP
jgi:outer membrane protein